MFPQDKRFFELRMKDLLAGSPELLGPGSFHRPLLGQADEIDSADVQLFEHLLGDVQLAFPTVDQDEIRKILLLEGPLVATKQDLIHHSVIVCPLNRFDLEMAVTVVGRLPIFEDDHGTHGMSPLDVGDIEGFNPSGEACEMKVFLQEFEECFAILFNLSLRPQELLRILTGHV